MFVGGFLRLFAFTRRQTWRPRSCDKFTSSEIAALCYVLDEGGDRIEEKLIKDKS